MADKSLMIFRLYRVFQFVNPFNKFRTFFIISTVVMSMYTSERKKRHKLVFILKHFSKVKLVCKSLVCVDAINSIRNGIKIELPHRNDSQQFYGIRQKLHAPQI